MTSKTLKLDTLLKLNRLDASKFITRNYPMAPVGSPGSFGGTQMAQSLLASMYTVPPTHIPNSFHCYFINAGDPEKHITYDVENLRTGNSYIHKQVRGYQDGRLIFTSLILFSKVKDKNDAVATHPHASNAPHPLVHHLKRLRDPPRPQESLGDSSTSGNNGEIHYVPAAELFKEAVDTIGPETVAKFPIFQKYHGLEHIKDVYDALDHYSPAEFYFPTDFYLNKEKTLKGTTSTGTGTGTKTKLNYLFRLRPESALITTALSRTITDPFKSNEQIEPTTDYRYNYAALAFLSDRYLLLTLPYFKNTAIYSHDFGCSLDHTIYFHRVPLVNEFMVMRVANPRSLGSRHLFEGDIYDLCDGDGNGNGDDATLLSSVLQEGLAGYGNVLEQQKQQQERTK